MPKITNAWWESKCSICDGKISQGDLIVTYQERGKGHSKYTHHLEPGCSPHTGERFSVDTETHRVQYFVNCLNILKKINEDWTLEEIASIAKVDVSSDMLGDSPVESHALGHFRLKLEEVNREVNDDRSGNKLIQLDLKKSAEENEKILLVLIEDISKYAMRQDIRAEALIILKEYE